MNPIRRSLRAALVGIALTPAVSWAQDPYGARDPSSPSPPAGNEITPTSNPGELFEPGETLAIVGDKHILAADVLPHVNQVLAPYKGKVPEETFQQQRRMVIAQLTRAHLETKILYLAFLRKVPADKIKEIHKRVEASFEEEFESERKSVEKMDKEEQIALVRRSAQVGRLVVLMKEQGVWSMSELDALLKPYGGSLAQEKQFYIENKLGKAMVSQSINFKPEISLDEMLKYYDDNKAAYEYPTRVRFEALAVRNNEFPSKDAAFKAICDMGNEVFYGANFGAVAKRSSQGLNADKGGYHDWTPRGTLASKSLEETLFSLEPGKLSQVIEDERGYYILRVTERQEAGRTPFEEVQFDIQDKLKKLKMQKQYETYVTNLREQTSVWTAFDDDPLLRQAVRSDASTGTKKR